MVPFSAPVGPFGAKIAAGSPKQGRQGQRSEPAGAAAAPGAASGQNRGGIGRKSGMCGKVCRSLRPFGRFRRKSWENDRAGPPDDYAVVPP